MADAQLDMIERYYDAVPRTAARVEKIGPFEVFVKLGGGWPYYARPRLGASTFSADDVERVRIRQRELGVPESFEWVAEVTPRLASAAQANGLQVHTHPLLVLSAARRSRESLAGIELRLIDEHDDLAIFGAVAELAFASPGTDIGTVGTEALEARAARRSAESVQLQRDRLRSGLTVSAVALVDGEPVAVGSHQPLAGVSEIVGVATLPAFRRRGIAGALTALLIDDALRRGVRTLFLSAGDDAVARVYERVGFRRLATACIAQPAASA